MVDHDPGSPNRPQQHELALARWDNEGGGGFGRAPVVPRDAMAAAPPAAGSQPERRQAGDWEIAQLRIRMAALESLVMQLLSDASEARLHRVGGLASHAPSPANGRAGHPR